MALTPMRWMALALAGFVLTPVVILRDVQHPEWQLSERDQLTQRSWVAERELRGAVEQMRILQLRDSLVRVAATSAPSFAIDDAFDRDARALVDSLVTALREEHATAARTPVSVFFVLDSVTGRRGQPRGTLTRGALAVDYVLPTDSSRQCIVIARVRGGPMVRVQQAELRSHISRERLLGPCAYVGQFGLPGATIRQWLDARGWQFAQRSSWTQPPRPWLDGSPAYPYRARIDLAYVMGSSGRACAGGRDQACIEALLHPEAEVEFRQTRMTFVEAVLTPGFFNPFVHGDNSWLTSSWPLGAREWTLLADMVRSLGAERFQRFWSSDLPPEQAFQAATETSLAAWTREWIETTYHPQTTGPALPAGATGFAAALLIVALGLTLVAARRRQTA